MRGSIDHSTDGQTDYDPTTVSVRRMSSREDDDLKRRLSSMKECAISAVEGLYEVRLNESNKNDIALNLEESYLMMLEVRDHTEIDDPEMKELRFKRLQALRDIVVDPKRSPKHTAQATAMIAGMGRLADPTLGSGDPHQDTVLRGPLVLDKKTRDLMKPSARRHQKRGLLDFSGKGKKSRGIINRLRARAQDQNEVLRSLERGYRKLHKMQTDPAFDAEARATKRKKQDKLTQSLQNLRSAPPQV